MTVAELIEKLQAIEDKQKEVMFSYDSRVCVRHITHVDDAYPGYYGDGDELAIIFRSENDEEHVWYDASEAKERADDAKKFHGEFGRTE